MVSVGLINPKSASNVAAVFRAAGCFGVDTIFYTGNRYGYAKDFNQDTKNVHSSVPCLAMSDFDVCRPNGATIVGVELTEGATALPLFKHPQDAYYVFGPEDGSLPQPLINQCDHVVYIPSNNSLNLAATVNVVLYDRLAKSKFEVSNEQITSARDKNNNTRLIFR